MRTHFGVGCNWKGTFSGPADLLEGIRYGTKYGLQQDRFKASD